MIFGDLGGLNLPDICLTGEEKPPKKPHPGNLSRPGIEPAAWQALRLPSVPQLILQPLHGFTYVTAHSPTIPLLHPRHSSFSNPSFAFPTSQALHLRHLTGRPCYISTVLTLSNRALWKPLISRREFILNPFLKYSLPKLLMFLEISNYYVLIRILSSRISLLSKLEAV